MKFAMIGCGGYIAPRHLKAIKDTNNTLICACDKADSVGILDSFDDNIKFFTEFERFDRYVEKLRLSNSKDKIDYVSICTPNYLHDAHIRFALRIGANAICEKPIVLNTKNIHYLKKLEEIYNKKVNTILQLRLHPKIKKLKEDMDKSKEIHKVDLTYITPRGEWYDVSWKGDKEKSGGIETNIGVHFFDMLLWIFGEVKYFKVDYHDNKQSKGFLKLEKADVYWNLSLEKKDLPKKELSSYRSLLIDGELIEFSDGFKELHTKSYEEIIKGNGYGLDDVLPVISLVERLREK